MKADAVIRGTGRYSDGVDSLEIWIDKSSNPSFIYEEGRPVPIQLQIGDQLYAANLRATRRNVYAWVSPSLHDREGQKTRLADALTKQGMQKNQKVQLEMEGVVVRVMPAWDQGGGLP